MVDLRKSPEQARLFCLSMVEKIKRLWDKLKLLHRTFFRNICSVVTVIRADLNIQYSESGQWIIATQTGWVKPNRFPAKWAKAKIESPYWLNAKHNED